LDLLKIGNVRDAKPPVKFEGLPNKPQNEIKNTHLKRMWTRDFVRTYLEANWYKYDVDRNDSMDHHEAYEFFIDLIPKT
jgi:hypothetical protein